MENRMELVRARNNRTIAIIISLLVHALLFYWVINQGSPEPVEAAANVLIAESK
ncbi:MAG: hypothetical protein IPL46_31435 [Saprospiraceae bacterium]|nr:hypothetical protein [Saprospiraceae bacterium]